jgi:hypothetical protein
MSTQVKIYVGEDTYTKWQAICQGFSSNSAAFAALVENYHSQNNKQEATMNDITDRVQQVSWLSELAANIAENLGEGTAEELVEYALSDEARASWGLELPAWFDAHDRRLLVDMVEKNLN